MQIYPLTDHGCGNPCRFFRYIDEISVIHNKRDLKRRIGDECGLVTFNKIYALLREKYDGIPELYGALTMHFPPICQTGSRFSKNLRHL